MSSWNSGFLLVLSENTVGDFLKIIIYLFLAVLMLQGEQGL